MYNLAASYNPRGAPAYYYSIDMDPSRDLMNPLITSICEYDPLFRQSHKELSDNLAAVLNKDKLVTQQFTELLAFITDKITSLKNKSISTRNELARIRDDLLLSIRNAENKLAEFEIQKAGLQGKKETLEKEISKREKDITVYNTLLFMFSWLIALIVQGLQPFKAALDDAKVQLNNNQRDIEWLANEKSHIQQLSEESKSAFNTNQRLINGCDNLLNNINNVQYSLKRFEGFHLLKGKLIALEKDWSGLMKISMLVL